MAPATESGEQFTFGGKVSRGIWTTLAGLVVGAMATAGASYSSGGDIGAATAAAEGRTSAALQAEVAVHRADTERALVNQRAEVAATLMRVETMQREMATTVNELGKAVSRIEGRLEPRLRR